MVFPYSHSDNNEDIKTEKIQRRATQTKGQLQNSAEIIADITGPKSTTRVHLYFAIWKPSKLAIMKVDTKRPPFLITSVSHYVLLRSEIQDSQ